ncbi:MAG TPA: radical SAM protein [Chitinophagales bacterium]|nr:radical SAM protein [Chitinophagales bacterium]
MLRERFDLAKNILFSNFGRLPFPYKLTLILTYWCNYKCRTCNIWQKRPEHELTTEELVTFFQKSNRFNWIDFSGGEIWIRDDFVAIVEAALKYCKNLALIHFPTNGYFTQKTVKGVKEILKMKPPKFIITVSMDGDEHTNDEIRGKKGGWRRQMDTFRQLRDLHGVDVVLGMTLSKHNAGLYKKTFEEVKKTYPNLHPRDFHVHIAHESSHFYGNKASELIDKGSQQTIIGELMEYRKSRGHVKGPVSFLENRYLDKVERYLKTGKTPVRCHSLSSSCFIDSWGNVYPCVTYDHRIANIRDYDYDLEKIWNLPETKQLQQEIWKGQCPQCWQPCEAYQSILGNLI